MASLPLSLRTYRFATSLFEPVAPILLRRRARHGKECPARIKERLGYSSRKRPDGELVWIHGASVGECLAVLPLIDALLEKRDRSLLLTSGTVTSAKMMAERLPSSATHQFAPVDTPRAVARFLAEWRPDAGIFVDSEIWPNMVIAAHTAGIPLGIVNGRMTEKSFAGWARAKGAAQSLLSHYEFVLAQDKESAGRFKALGAHAVEISGNLKADAAPLPANENLLAGLRREIGGRPVFLATNTHDGEETLLLSVHDTLRGKYPSLLTIIAPRHAERGGKIAELCGKRALARRSQQQSIDGRTEIYIADTMGELGTLYRLAPFAFIGKSLAGEGGQNPLEPARLGAAVLAGPHTDNFREAYEAIFAAQGFGRVRSSEDVGALADKLLSEPETACEAGKAAEQAVLRLSGALERTRDAVESILRRHARA